MDNFEAHKIPLKSSIFAIAAHPTEPLFTAGLLSGHVYTYTWPKVVPDDGDEDEDTLSGGYKVAWKTRRHKGSCRSVAYSHDAQVIYSAGTDSLLKAASPTTGQVTAKALIPEKSSKEDFPTHLLPITPTHLLLGTDSGTIHLYDTRDSSIPVKPSITWLDVHDYISSISPLPPTSESTSNLPRSFITTGDSTLAYLDIRKGVLSKSEDQEDETLSSCVVGGVGKGGRSTRAYIGMGDGVVHAFERGVWSDMCERMKIAPKGVEVDLLREYNADIKGSCIAAGCGDGKVRILQLGGNKVVRVFEHSAENDGDVEEGVTGLAFDCDGALITAGGSVVKVWYQNENLRPTEESEDDEDEKDIDDGSDSEDDKPTAKQKTRKLESDSDDSDEGGSKSSQRRKKKRKNKHQGTGIKKPQFNGLD